MICSATSQALAWLGHRSRSALALGFLLAMMVPALAETLRPMLPLAVAGLLMVAALRTDTSALLAQFLPPTTLLIITGMMLLLAPAVVYLCTRALPLPTVLVAALVLSAALPPLFAVPAMAGMLRLNVPLALGVVMLATVVSPFTLGPVAALLLELELAVTPVQLMGRLAGLVLSALLLGFGLRRWLGSARVSALDSSLSGVIVLLLLVFAVAIMKGVPAAFVNDPSRVVLFVAAAFALNVMLQLLGGICAWPLGRQSALTVGFASGNRSLGLLLAVLPASTDPGLGLFFALGQFPIYLLPFVLGALYRRVLEGSDTA